MKFLFSFPFLSFPSSKYCSFFNFICLKAQEFEKFSYKPICILWSQRGWTKILFKFQSYGLNELYNVVFLLQCSLLTLFINALLLFFLLVLNNFLVFNTTILSSIVYLMDLSKLCFCQLEMVLNGALWVMIFLCETSDLIRFALDDNMILLFTAVLLAGNVMQVVRP